MSVIDIDGVSLTVALEPCGTSGHDDLRAEFQRLRVRAARQVQPSDTSRKTEIVFDTRAGSGLPARHVRLEHQHLQTFGSTIHGRGESRGAGTDDDYIGLAVSSMSSLKPRHSAICELVGFRSTASPRQITTGMPVTSI
jgi:hypothetical protein